MKRPRIIPTLLIDNGNLVKTKKFNNPRYLGDPINAIRIFNEKGVDELCILDISATKDGKELDFELLQNMATESFMPLSYGGGVKSIEQIKKLFRIGYEKVVINTAANEDVRIINEASAYFGSQSVVAAIDYRQTLFGKKCCIRDGAVKTKISPEENAVRFTEAGAGEILLYSIDHDGMRDGYDLDMIKCITGKVKIPVIACGGADSISDLKKALDAGANAVAAGSLFCFFGERQAVLINFPEEKELIEYGIYG